MELHPYSWMVDLMENPICKWMRIGILSIDGWDFP